MTIAESRPGTEENTIANFVSTIRPAIRDLGYEIATQAALPYTNFCDKVDIAGKGHNYPQGQKTYIVDALIYKPLTNGDRIPLVVLEGKIKTQTTHDIITYSAKAQAHKNVFPHLRYGFIVLNARGEFPDFYYQHANFDFEQIFPSTEPTAQSQARVAEFIAELARQIEKARERYQKFFKTEV